MATKGENMPSLQARPNAAAARHNVNTAFFIGNPLLFLFFGFYAVRGYGYIMPIYPLISLLVMEIAG
jgi:hypothetical protein